MDFSGEVDGIQLSSPDDFAKYLRSLEPNLGNIAFSSRVVIVEGPHDILAYRTALSTATDLGLKNVAIVGAWGKDTIGTIVQVCAALRSPVSRFMTGIFPTIFRMMLRDSRASKREKERRTRRWPSS